MLTIIQPPSSKHEVVLLPAAGRTTLRPKTTFLGTVTNITRETKQETALLLEMSSSSVRIETTLTVSPGDALRIDLPDSTLLAEAVYCERTSESIEIRLKLFHSLKQADLARCVEPEIWSEFLSP